VFSYKSDLEYIIQQVRYGCRGHGHFQRKEQRENRHHYAAESET
jgi:hypothetical protein